MRFICLIFLLRLLLVSGFCFAEKPNNANSVITYKYLPAYQIDTVKKKESIIQKIKKAFQFKANFKKAEEERVNAIFNKLMASNTSKDTVPHTIYKTETLPIEAVQAQIDSLFKDFTSSVDLNQNSPNDIQQLVDKLLPMMKKKIELQENEEKRQKNVKMIRELMPYSNGIIYKVSVNHQPVKTIHKTLFRKSEVFGFHPYWMNKCYLNYNYKALSTLIYYGYELNGKTGSYKSIHGWDTTQVVTKAKKAGCKVLLCIFSKNIKNTEAFLKNETAQINLANEVSKLLKQRNADGVNFIFDDFGMYAREDFTKFISLFSGKLKKEKASYQLTLTLPVIDKNLNYDIQELNPYVEHFIIDFSKKSSYGPISPIKGTDYSLDAGIDRYLNSNVSPKKFIACLTYNGVLWEYKKQNSFYKSYNTIIDKYMADNTPVYTKNDGVRIDVLNREKDTIHQIWYDDAQTLAEKYDFILAKGIAGVGIWGLGSDDGKPELWNALIDKTITIKTKTTILHPPKPIGTLESYQNRISLEMHLYKKLFYHPCSFTTTDQKTIKGDDYIKYITAILFIALTLVALFSSRQVRTLGTDWEKRKLFYSVLIFLIILLAISIMLSLFLNPSIAGFGASADKNDCETSFGTILKILGGGFLVGLLAMQFLVFPMIQPREIP